MQKELMPGLDIIKKKSLRKKPDDLLKRMRDRISDLVEKQFDVDHKIVINSMVGKEIVKNLSYYASEREKEKMS